MRSAKLIAPATVEKRMAQEVIAKIRKWVREKKKASGGKAPPRLAVKFCGGCNPEYSRGSLVRFIRQGVSEKGRWIPREESKADLLLILDGCQTGCADLPEVWAEASFHLVINGTAVGEIQS